MAAFSGEGWEDAMALLTVFREGKRDPVPPAELIGLMQDLVVDIPRLCTTVMTLCAWLDVSTDTLAAIWGVPADQLTQMLALRLAQP
jgi:hypothetical protein